MVLWGKRSRKERKSQISVKNRKKRKLLAFFLIAILAAAAVLVLEQALAPNIRAQAGNTVHNQATRIIADTISNRINEDERISDYGELMQIQRDDQGRIAMLTVDTALINSFSNELLSELETALAGMEQKKLQIPLFSAGNSRILAGIGPKLPVKVQGVAMPAMELRDSFIAAGINQTKHSIYLEITTEIQVIIPFDSQIITVSSTMLLAEGIIVGQIPDTYLNFNNQEPQ